MTELMSPAVSVVMAVHNSAEYLREAVDSIVAQTMGAWELVAVDDGSTDESGAILDEYAARDPRVKVIHSPHRGYASSLNAGVALTQTPFVARLDADDAAFPRRLEVQLSRLLTEPTLGVVGGAVVFIDAAGRRFAEARYPLDDEGIRKAFTTTTPFVHSAVTIRRDAFDAAGGYRPAFTAAEDLDLWLRIPSTFTLANLEDPVVRYRVHVGQMSVTELERQAVSAAAARHSARNRLRGDDPLALAATIDADTLRAAGVSRRDVAHELVHNAVWLGKTFARAGDGVAADHLFARAASEARSEAGSSVLATFVYDQLSRRCAEEGRRVAALGWKTRAALQRAVNRPRATNGEL
jgi:glycosyltransferase involved in cell wall biosynthesis